jgi:hypothetical protein
MFRIIQFKVPSPIVEQWINAEKHAIRMFFDYCKSFRENGDHWYSEPMATTSTKFFACEQIMRSLAGDPPHLIEDLTEGYRLLRTRAPKAYDYDYCIDIGAFPGESGEERLVALPIESVAYQSGRYSSGMFTPITCA